VAIGTKFVELGLTPSDSYKFYAPHRKALFDKRLKNHSPEGFEMDSNVPIYTVFNGEVKESAFSTNHFLLKPIVQGHNHQG